MAFSFGVSNMELRLLRMFQYQVALQCKFLILSAKEIERSLGERDVENTFYAIQNFLNSGANISKALWGQCGRHADERKQLRDSVGIGDNSPLRKVTMRNNFEHFDERLDKWWKKSKRHAYADMLIGNKDMIGGIEKKDTFRRYDPVTTDIVFWGQEFNLKQLLTEAKRILPKLEEEANKPH